MNHTPQKPTSLCIFATVLALGATACGSGDKTTPSTNSASSTGKSGTSAGTDGGATAAGCDLHTQFAGDENCILEPTDGLQLHVGPPDYDNPGADWIVQPGDESVACYHMTTKNTEEKWYFEQQYRMRPGSHHMIISTSTNETQAEGWAPCGSSIISAIGGTQHVIEDFPPGLKVADEDKGLGHSLAAAQPLDIQLHFFNVTDSPTLREAWVNFIYKDKSEVTQPLGMLGAFAPVNVPPHSTAVTGGTCNASDALPPPGPDGVRIVSLFGHAHWHNQRFVVYKDQADGTSGVVYDSYDGAEAPTYVFNSLIQNPTPNAAARTSGANSGDFFLEPTDQLRFECDITNDLNTSLVSTNEAFTGEMCILFGSVVGAGFPCFKLGQTK